MARGTGKCLGKCTRLHRKGTHLGGHKIVAQAVCVGLNAVLGGAVGATAGCNLMRPDTADVDDMAMVLLFHVRYDRLCHCNDTLDIGVKDLVHVLHTSVSRLTPCLRNHMHCHMRLE